jgi:hypothetical protein
MDKLTPTATAYVEVMLWTSTGADHEDENMAEATFDEISDETLVEVAKDCADFEAAAGDLLEGLVESQIGHDLWLTRNGHGAGFWDRDLGAVGDKLTLIAEAMGGTDLYRGDDGLLYLS